MTKEERLLLLNQVFTPNAPIKQRDFFRGRILQLTKVVDAINEPGQHAILYGERGVGKTSLANIMESSYTNIYPIKITCSRQDTFETIWQQVFDRIQFSTTIAGIGFSPQQKEKIINLGTNLKNIDNISPSFIVNLLSQISKIKFLFLFDEFDNITNRRVRTLMADLIKSFSDNLNLSTIVLVGIADNVEDLIGIHQSLERCLKQVKMPRMTYEESAEIIQNGLNMLEIAIGNNVKNKIIEFASGFPHYVHLLCKYGAKEIIGNDKKEFSEAYLNIAIKTGIENTSEQLRSSYQKATVDSKENSKWKAVLHACANSECDAYNCFSIGNVLNQYNILTGKKVIGSNIIYNLNQLCNKERGEVLMKSGKGVSTRFRFINPMMRAFVKLKINSN